MAYMDMGILIKFNDEDLVFEDRKSTTIIEHLDVLKHNGKVIWGQGSHRIKQLADKRVRSINEEIKNRGYIYVFFVTSKKAEKTRGVFVGRCTKLYIKGDLGSYSEDIKYVPKYYSSKIGTEVDDNIALFELNEIVNISEDYLTELYLLSNSEQQVMRVNNMNSLFYVTMKEKIKIELEKRFKLKDTNKKKLKQSDDSLYQEEIENQFSDEFKGVEEGKGRYTTSVEKFKRDPSRGKRAIMNANYRCELGKEHQFFISNITGENYVEAHHLVPMEYSELFNDVNIDVEDNIVSLCVVCHKKLHHGKVDDKIEILKVLHNDRFEKLRKKGININLEELINLYI